MSTVSATLPSRVFPAIVKALLANKGDEMGALAYAQARNFPPQAIAVLKSAVNAGSLADASWAGSLAPYEAVTAAFLSWLSASSAFFRMYESFTRAPLRTRTIVSSSAASGTIVGEGQITPISNLSLAGKALDVQKAVATLVVSEELARLETETGDALIRNELRKGVAASVDTEFFRTLRAASATAVASSGSTAQASRSDLRALTAAVTAHGEARFFFVMPSAVAKKVALLGDTVPMFPDVSFNSGGEMLGVPVIISEQVAAGEIWLIDAQQIAADLDTITISPARHATIQMETSPDSPETASTTPVNLWQHNLVGLKAMTFFGLKLLRTTGAAYLTGVTWGANDSP